MKTTSACRETYGRGAMPGPVSADAVITGYYGRDDRARRRRKAVSQSLDDGPSEAWSRPWRSGYQPQEGRQLRPPAG